ncbi:hypothetical protein ABB02_01225 [Clostridiaceae bacterium JG1575]|nr:hypothetical protein ABB02_01225 [Clostridiaceae bacterium JG1575]
MRSNWLQDMLKTLGLGQRVPEETIERRLEKTKYKMTLLKREIRSLEKRLLNLKTLIKINSSVSGLVILFNFIRFSWTGIFLAIGYNVVSNIILNSRKTHLKQSMDHSEEDMKALAESLEEMLARQVTPTDPVPEDSYVDAEIIEENVAQESVQEPSQKAGSFGNSSDPFGVFNEAQVAYARLEELRPMVREMEQHDREMAVLFQNAWQSAVKVGNYIKDDREKEGRSFRFFNQVETLYEWTQGLLDLERSEVYDSLMVNVKANAQKALPVLQAKIDNEYYKLINPKIMDLEAEMEVMSKENI